MSYDHQVHTSGLDGKLIIAWCYDRPYQNGLSWFQQRQERLVDLATALRFAKKWKLANATEYLNKKMKGSTNV